MYAKSFIALDGNGRLTGARTAQAAPYANYTCHLCGSALRYHPQYETELPWFEHTDDRLTEHGQQCPYVRPERREIQLINSYRMPYPWCVTPAGTADNVTTIIMGSSTAHTARPEDSVFPGQLRRKYANSELLYGE